MNIIGISAYYHDSAAVLVQDGKIVAAAQEERFTRVKHDYRFPESAVAFCLKHANLSSKEIDYVVFYDKPLLKFDRLLETYLAYAPRGFSSFTQAMSLWLKQKLFIRREIRKKLGEDFKGKIVFTQHHESHAASAFFPSPFESAAVLSADGVGEWATATVGKGQGNKIELLKQLNFPHSLGLLYSAFTYFCGFKVNSGEYKLMGLAPYGHPKYVDDIREKLVEVKDDGSIWLDMSYFDYCAGLKMTSEKFDELFGGKPRKPEDFITQREMDIAASIQLVTEDIMLKMAKFAKKVTGSRNLCLAGGVALNCVANGKILKTGEFDNIWIQPASGDAGGALGAALFVWYQLLEKPRYPVETDSQAGSLLGPAFDNRDIKNFLDQTGARYSFLGDDSLFDTVADSLSEGKIIGWFSGRMEFGPRALGGRSIIGDARNSEMQSRMNLKIKYRESFRPFAPSVLKEDAGEYFELDSESPYMLLVAPVRENKRRKLDEDEIRIQNGEQDLRKRVNIVRSSIPAVTHVDYSARIQTVDAERHGKYYRLIKRFKEKTGCPVIVNTSFNVRGEPIVCTPEDAFKCFMNTEMDILVLENYFLRKADQKKVDSKEKEKYIGSFHLD